jgi:alpha-mannosidase
MLHDITWTWQKIEQRLAMITPWIFRRRQPLHLWRFQAVDGPLDAPPASLAGEMIPPGRIWAGPDQHFALHTSFAIPPDWPEPAALIIDIGEAGDFSHPEALLFIDGQRVAAVDRHHREVGVEPAWRDGSPHALVLLGWTGGTQALRFDPAVQAPPRRPLVMGESFLAAVDEPTREFIALARVALGAARVLDENHPARHHLLTALDDAFKRLDIRAPRGEAFYASISEALALLRAGVDRAGPALGVDITAAGHAHIDVAWLWPLSETRGKARRTFTNVTRLMDAFPDFIFAQSQPQLYEFVREDDPALFETIRQQVAAGQWEPLGGMWVEPDCNLAGPEALARQLLLGRSYFREHFGPDAETPVLWLPDVFGFPWSLPQLAKNAGLDYFFTIKLGWSQYNRFPYDAFWWQGIDGTRILAHFSTTGDLKRTFVATYNARATPEEAYVTWSNFQQKDAGPPGVTPPLLMAYGHGDGGGGPTREMIENIREMGDFPGLPRVRMGKVGDYFRELEARVGERLPTWNGELYLEYHRGVYTSQARIKRANRKNEFRLHDAEFLAAWASALAPDYRYPHADLQEAWRLLALNQFHDILPGSSIARVYEDALAQHQRIAAIADRVQDDALATLGRAFGGDWLLINPTSFTRSDPVFLPLDIPPDRCPAANHTLLDVQPVAGGVLVDAGELPPYSITPLTIEPYCQIDLPSACTAAPHRLENDLLRVELNDAGNIIRIFDKARKRDLLPPGAVANQFQAFEDRPRTPDAWEIDIFYDDKMWLADPATRIEVVENGPLRAALEIHRRILDSDIVQRISLTHNAARIDFDTRVAWRERHVLLKVAFPVDILAPNAVYEIPWGRIQRPTHRNTSWDWAKFEVPAQKWADLSENDYGVSLINDSKYGYDIRGNVMRLSLLRGPTDPDPTADLGEHRFTYSLLPHAGPVGEITLAHAYALNDPVIVAAGPGGPPRQETQSLITASPANVVIETIKAAEDGRGIIVRLFESQRRRGPVTLTTSLPLTAAFRTNLLEEEQEALEVQENVVQCRVTPFQILTLRMIRDWEIGDAIAHDLS